jgi:transposase-like protein
MKKQKTKPKEFDFTSFEREAISKLRAGKGFTGPDGAFTGLIKHILETALDSEIEAHLETDQETNRRNGHTSKRVKTSLGEVGIRPPRDRKGDFDPKILGKWERNLAPEIECQIIELYSMGTSYADIRDHVEKMYGLHYSTGFISSLTDRINDEIEAWKTRALESVYSIIFLDAIHYKVRENREVKTKAVYTVLGVDLEGNRDVLGLFIGAAEGARHWGRILEDIHERGVEDVLFFCVDGLKGFTDTIESIYPQAIIQRCIVHMVRTSLRYVSWKDYKGICKDLRKVYQSSDRETAEERLKEFGANWDHKYPEIRKKWNANWNELSAFYDYPEAIRKVIYTTNAVESLHRSLRKVTKTKGAFVSEKALEKQLYLALVHSSKSWKRRIRSWPTFARTIEREFEDRILKWQHD